MGWRDDDFGRSEREYLPRAFELLFGREFNYEELRDRRMMQEVMLIAQCRGVSIGEYSWSRYKVGMYSQGLQDDLYENSKGVEKKKHLPEEWVMTLGCIRGILRWGEKKYGLDEWARCLSDMWLVYGRQCSPIRKEKVVKEVKELVKDCPSDEMLEDAFDCCGKLENA